MRSWGSDFCFCAQCKIFRILTQVLHYYVFLLNIKPISDQIPSNKNRLWRNWQITKNLEETSAHSWTGLWHIWTLWYIFCSQVCCSVNHIVSVPLLSLPCSAVLPLLVAFYKDSVWQPETLGETYVVSFS